MNKGQKYVQEICHKNLQKRALFGGFRNMFADTIFRQCTDSAQEKYVVK